MGAIINIKKKKIEKVCRSKICVKGNGSVCLGGDYGVYSNGDMIQLTIPQTITIEKLDKNSACSKNKILIHLYHPQSEQYISSKDICSDEVINFYGKLFVVKLKTMEEKILKIKEILELLINGKKDELLNQVVKKFPELLTSKKLVEPEKDFKKLKEQIEKEKEELKKQILNDKESGLLNKIEENLKKLFSKSENSDDVKQLKEEIEGDIKKLKELIITSIKAKIKEYIPKLLKIFEDKKYDLTIFDQPIKIIAEYPYGEGLGDSFIPVVVTFYLCQLFSEGQLSEFDLSYFNPFYNEEVKEKNSLIPGCKITINEYFEIIKFFLWLLSYPNTSYLRPLASYFKSGDVSFLLRKVFVCEKKSNKIKIVDRFSHCNKDLKSPEECIHTAAFKIENLCSINLFDILFQVNSKKDLYFDGGFVVVHRPRRLFIEGIINTSSGTSTATGVKSISQENLGLFEILGNLTREIWKDILNVDCERLGEDITTYHVLLGKLKRTSPIADEMIFSIRNHLNITGGKVSGSGPDGGVVLSFCGNLDFVKLKTFLNQYDFSIITIVNPE